jgi:hypothetical protein
LISQRSEKHFADGREFIGKIYALNEEDFAGLRRSKRSIWKTARSARMKLSRHSQGTSPVRLLPCRHRPAHRGADKQSGVYRNLPLGGALAINGTINVGEVVAFVLYAKLFAGPLESISGGLSTMQHTLASAGRV